MFFAFIVVSVPRNVNKFDFVDETLDTTLWIGIIITAQAFQEVPGRHAVAVADTAVVFTQAPPLPGRGGGSGAGPRHPSLQPDGGRGRFGLALLIAATELAHTGTVYQALRAALKPLGFSS